MFKDKLNLNFLSRIQQDVAELSAEMAKSKKSQLLGDYEEQRVNTCTNDSDIVCDEIQYECFTMKLNNRDSHKSSRALTV